MSTRYNNGSHYQNHPEAAGLHDGATHVHRAGEQHGKQDHLTGHEYSRQALEHSSGAHQNDHAPVTTVAHGIATFEHGEIEALADEHWQARGCPHGSAQEDWFHAAEELPSRAATR